MKYIHLNIKEINKYKIVEKLYILLTAQSFTHIIDIMEDRLIARPESGFKIIITLIIDQLLSH